MINYLNPTVELLPNPVALDFAIQAIQAKLAELTWLEKAFGRCTPQEVLVDTKDGQAIRKEQQRKVVIPEVYQNREPISLMVNDNLQSYCFFHAIDPLRFPAYEAFTTSEMAEQPVAIIFWANLQKVDSSKQYNFQEELRAAVVQKLKRCPSFKITESSIQYNNVFRPFTVTETFRQYLKPPYCGFRFDGVLTFDYYQCE